MSVLPVLVGGVLPRAYWMQTLGLSRTRIYHLVSECHRPCNTPLQGQEVMHQAQYQFLPRVERRMVLWALHDSYRGNYYKYSDAWSQLGYLGLARCSSRLL